MSDQRSDVMCVCMLRIACVKFSCLFGVATTANITLGGTIPRYCTIIRATVCRPLLKTKANTPLLKTKTHTETNTKNPHKKTTQKTDIKTNTNCAEKSNSMQQPRGLRTSPPFHHITCPATTQDPPRPPWTAAQRAHRKRPPRQTPTPSPTLHLQWNAHY